MADQLTEEQIEEFREAFALFAGDRSPEEEAELLEWKEHRGCRSSKFLPKFLPGACVLRRAARPFVQCGMTRTVHCLVAASEVSTRFLFPEPFALAFVVVFRRALAGGGLAGLGEGDEPLAYHQPGKRLFSRECFRPGLGWASIVPVLMPLTAFGVDLQVLDHAVLATYTQTFANPECLEVTYSFPVRPKASIAAMRAEVDGRLVVGRVVEKAAARDQYEEARAQRKAAALLEKATGDVMRLSIGQISPGSQVVVQVELVWELGHLGGGSLRLGVPMLVGPRYPLGVIDMEDMMLRQEAIALDEAGQGPGAAPFSLRAKVSVASPLLEIKSPTHAALEVSLDGCEAEAALSLPTMPYSEIVVLLEVAEVPPALCWLEADEENEDRSQAVQHSAAKPSRAAVALQLFLRTVPFCVARALSLPVGCYFDIVGFGSRWSSLFGGSRPYNAETLQIASEHVQRVKADLGGTELMGPLTALLSQPPHAGFERRLVLLTDGQVCNTAAVLDFVRDNAKATNIYTVGIGNGVSHELVEGSTSSKKSSPGGQVGFMEIFRPRCSAAVRHQLRLEMLLGLVPALCTLSVILAAVAGELKNSNYTGVLLLHVVLLLVVIGIGLWMKVNNSLDSFVHYLEDTQRSNDLLVACSWAPLLLHLVPMLFIGDANGLTDTYMTVIGYFLLYVPVLDTPYYSFVSYAAYSCLACIRISRAVLSVST
eukprot:s53_g7.t3